MEFFRPIPRHRGHSSIWFHFTFFSHLTRSTTWEDPRLLILKEQQQQQQDRNNESSPHHSPMHSTNNVQNEVIVCLKEYR